MAAGEITIATMEFCICAVYMPYMCCSVSFAYYRSVNTCMHGRLATWTHACTYACVFLDLYIICKVCIDAFRYAWAPQLDHAGTFVDCLLPICASMSRPPNGSASALSMVLLRARDVCTCFNAKRIIDNAIARTCLPLLVLVEFREDENATLWRD